MVKPFKLLTVLGVGFMMVLNACSYPETPKGTETFSPQAINREIDVEGTTSQVYFGTAPTQSSTTHQQIFYDDYSSPNQWYRTDMTNEDSQGNPVTATNSKVFIDTTQKRANSKSLKMQTTVTSNPTVISRRSEIIFLNPALTMNVEHFSGFSVRFPSGTEPFTIPTPVGTSNWTAFHQWWQQSPLAPAVAFEVKPGATSSSPIVLEILVRNNSNNSAPGAPNGPIVWPDNRAWANGATNITLARDKWHDFIVQLRVAPAATTTNNSILRVWLDGVLIVDYPKGEPNNVGDIGYRSGTTIDGTPINSTTVNEKFGLYRSAQTINSTLFYDELRQTNSFYEAIPAPQLRAEFTSLSNWTTEGSGATWSINGSRLYQANDPAGTDTSLVTAYYNPASAQSWTNYRVYGEFQRDADDDLMGLTFYRTNSTTQYYIFSQSNDPGPGNAACYLQKWNGSTRVTLAKVTTPPECTNTTGVFTMTVTVKAEGTNTRIIALLNGKQIFNHLEPNANGGPTAGTVGVYSHKNRGFADNVVVSFIP
jgi:Polysaccharide lyase